jgi:uncharacterized protein YbjT (DUF2867 family)
MNVALAGGTGFIGKVVIKKLVEHGHHVIVLARPGSLIKVVKFSGTEIRYVYYDSPKQVAKIIEDSTAVINLVGIIRETKSVTFDFAHHLIPMILADSAKQVGISRFIQMSALGVDSDIGSRYFESKRKGEEAIKKRDFLQWTFFRPSVVYGPEDEFVNMLARMIRRLPRVPVIGDGNYQLQPVWVEDVAEGFARCLEMPQTIGKAYEIGGPEKFTYNQMLDLIGQALGKKSVKKIHLPLGMIQTLTKLIDPLGIFPITSDQITMLLAENTTDKRSYWDEFNITPKIFAEGLKEYIKPNK